MAEKVHMAVKILIIRKLCQGSLLYFFLSQAAIIVRLYPETEIMWLNPNIFKLFLFLVSRPLVSPSNTPPNNALLLPLLTFAMSCMILFLTI